MELQQISPRDVSDFIFKQRGEAVKASTIHKHLQVLQKLFNLAEEFGYEVERNPVRPFHFASESEYRRTRVLGREEEESLMREAAPHLRPMIQTALETGDEASRDPEAEDKRHRL